MSKPEFIDNRNGNTLAEALRSHLDWLAETYKSAVTLSIATGYFNPAGFQQIAAHLERVSHIRLLLGAEPLTPPVIPKRMPGKDRRGPAFRLQLLRGALDSGESGIRADRDLLPFTRDTDSSVRRLLEFLASGKVEVRRYEHGFLHGKAFIFSTDEGVIAGSSNFTGAGLTENQELNLGHYQPGLVSRVKEWFDQLWDESVPYDLAAIYEERYAEYDPYLIYLRVLWELYKDELEVERKPSGRIELTTFQTDGIDRAQRILARYNGVIIADGVGLGKTFIAAQLMHLIQEQRQRVLLISPAALRDGTWQRFQERTQLRFENVSYEQFLLNSYSFPAEDYEMVVIDEAQAFRNPGTARSAMLRSFLQGKRPKKLVLLSATPVNNSLWDLYYLISYFIRHDAEFADRGIRSVKDRFDWAEKTNPFDLSPDLLFDVLDPVTVRRTRHFVKKWYPNERIKGPGGEEMLVRFPKPHVHKVDYDLRSVLPNDFFMEFEQALAPETGEPALTMARYRPSDYLLRGESSAMEHALVGLIRTAMLKRFESSGHAFARTCTRLADSHDLFLEAIERGFVPTPEAMQELAEMDSDEAFDEILITAGSLPISAFRIDRLRADVLADRDMLREYANVGISITPDKDPKLHALIEQLIQVLHSAEKDSADARQLGDNRKVLIFSYYGDTVEWIFEYLKQRLDTDRRMAQYRGRLAAIVGDRALQGGARESTVWGFAPNSTEAPQGRDADLYDILITTDVLAEGLNLQQCRNIINYDLPWNPMRLVQRHGRIDRIGSPHSDVYIRCIFPDRELDGLLALERRIRRKLAQAAASIGVESEVIPGSQTADIVFAETRDEIESLRKGDATLFETAGEAEGAHSGEEYRQELRKGLETRERDIKSLPWGAGSGHHSSAYTGWMFCAKIGEKTFLRFIPAESEQPLIRDTLGVLRRIWCEPGTPRHLPGAGMSSAYDAWVRARRDIYLEWMAGTDPKNLQPKIRPLFRQSVEHIRQFPPIDIEKTTIEYAVDALSAPWGIKYERELRPILTDESTDPVEKSMSLIQKIHELGMSPSPPPEPLPPIDVDEVSLVCWMGIGTD